MAIARIRTKGPVYCPKTYRGTLYNWSFKVEGGQVVWYWKKGTDYYYPPFDGAVLTEQAYCADSTHPGPPYREGGPLYLMSGRWPVAQVASGTWYNSVRTQKYVGSFVAYSNQQVGWQYVQSAIPSESLSALGPTAWNRFRPTKPKVNLGQFLAELREFKDLFRMPWKSLRKLDFDKFLAAGYVNYRFGWSPFIRDIIDAINCTMKLESTVDYLRKNNNRWIKRRGTLHDKVSSDAPVETTGMVIYPFLPANFYVSSTPASQPMNVRVVKHDRCWFEALWKYYIPDLPFDKADHVTSSRVLRHLYGLELNSNLAWELLPWSWLADWFANIGDNFANMSNQEYDNLVAKYAYLMRQRTVHIQTAQSIPMVGGPTLTVPSYSAVFDCKERAGASPYGFSVDWPDFTEGQLAILAALKISKSR